MSKTNTVDDTVDKIRLYLTRPVNNPAETAVMVGASVSTVRRHVASGELPARKVGRSVYISTPVALEFFGATVGSVAS